jgi:hypothetical protein
VEAASLVAFFVVCILGPLVMFSPRLAAAKRQGLREYGAFAARYVQGFDEKWIRRGADAEEQPLGSGDIRSLADLDNSFAVVRQMRAVPFGLDAVTRLAAATAAPLAPLALTIMPFEVLLQRLIKILI